MANQQLFKSSPAGKLPTPADTLNKAGGLAYQLSPEQALAQYACTSFLGGTYYTGAEEELGAVMSLAERCSSEFIAATAVYARQVGYMKDMPALLCAILTARAKTDAVAQRCLPTAFHSAIDNGKMVRNYAQIIRSGITGRKSFGSMPARLVSAWLNSKHPNALFRDSVGDKPSMRDVLRMVRPHPKDDQHRALFGYIVGAYEKEGGPKGWDPEKLPPLVKQYEQFKTAVARGRLPEDALALAEVPDVPFQMLDSLGLNDEDWKGIARNAKWQMTRMNLNTFKRHGVFNDPAMVQMVADRLRDGDAIASARVFPYQLLNAYLNIDVEIPHQVKEALHDAMEIATDNVRSPGRGALVVDVSASMGTAVTGGDRKVPSKATCVQVASMIAAVLFRKNPESLILPVDTALHIPRQGFFSPRDTIMTIAGALSRFGGGGTNLSLPLAYLLEKKIFGLDYVLFASDVESWVDQPKTNFTSYGSMMSTQTLALWEQYKAKSPSTKMVCINLQASGTTQAPTRADILNIGGFSDQVFNVINAFMEGGDPDHWVNAIKENWRVLTTTLA